jgi:hypothetical protein
MQSSIRFPRGARPNRRFGPVSREPFGFSRSATNASEKTSVPPHSTNTASFEPGTGFDVRPFLHDILERRRVPHYSFEVLRTRQRYFWFLASPDTTLHFNLILRPAMRLLSLAANHVALVFICDSQGVPHEKRSTDRLALLKLYGIVS